ncbi:MAG: phenylalanine--tRNA ligase subunit beta [bacterium]
MKISLKWINEILNQTYTAQDIAQTLGRIGFQVESIEQKSEHIRGVVVGEVRAVKPHPDADKLSVCTVFDGHAELTVVCGAPNVKAGIKVPFAKAGAVLPGNFEIKQAKIRGVESNGMICSEKELGISDEAQGIMHLPETGCAGNDFCTAAGLDDTAIEFEVTPNRPDVLSHIGIAREIAAARKIPLILLKAKTKFISAVECLVLNDDAQACTRYCAQLIEGVKVGPSPDFVVQRLTTCGIRSINNIVDITNYILLETGQPLHAFDYDLLKGNLIHVRRAHNESMPALDGITYKLSKDALVIADAEKPVAIAGIIGGEEAAVTKDTKNILLESACFSPGRVRQTAQKLGISTESSYRFERGVNMGAVQAASLKAVDMILMCAGGEKTKSKEIYPKEHVPTMVDLRPERVNAVLGTDISKQVMADILNRLRFEMQNKSLTDKYIFKVPSYRVDVKEEIDLIEEIARHNGYDAIPSNQYSGKIMKEVLPETWQFKEEVRSILNGLGLYEAYNYGFMSSDDPAKLMINDGNEKKLVSVVNPIAQHMTVLKNTLLPGLIRNAEINQSQKNISTRLYEISMVFENNEGILAESAKVAILITGKKPKEVWNTHSGSADYAELSGMITVLLEKLRIPDFAIVPHEAAYLQPGQSAHLLIHGTKAGELGRLHPHVLDNYGLHEAVYVCEIDFSILKQTEKKTKKYKPLPKYPSIKRDFSFKFSLETTWKSIKEETEKAGKPLIESIVPFDKYTGKQSGENTYGLSFSVVLRAKDKTLTDADADAVQHKIIQNLTKKLGAHLRTS